MGESEDREATLAIVLETKLIQTKIVLQMLFIGMFIFLQKIPYGECNNMLNCYATLQTYGCILVGMEFDRIFYASFIFNVVISKSAHFFSFLHL